MFFFEDLLYRIEIKVTIEKEGEKEFSINLPSVTLGE